MGKEQGWDQCEATKACTPSMSASLNFLPSMPLLPHPRPHSGDNLFKGNIEGLDD